MEENDPNSPRREQTKTNKGRSFSKGISLLLGTTTLLILLKATKSEEKPNKGKKETNSELDHEHFYAVASQAYFRLNKSLTLTISDTIISQYHHQTMWYVNYTKVREPSQATKYLGTHDPLLRLVTVMERGVYFSFLSQTWKDLDVRSDQNTKMSNLFEVPISNPITASHMERNQSLVAVAYKNLTVEVIDMNTAQKIDLENNSFYSYNSVSFDTAYRFGVEEDHEVLAIAQIPATDYLIFSSNRFEIFKGNRKTGEVLGRFKNPLEKIGKIAIPSLSHRTEVDPFNPNSKKDPEISKKNLELAYQKDFIAAGADDPMNAFIDWTTMKPLKFFSLHLQFDSGRQREDDIIWSVVYYAGVPQACLYLMTSVGNSDKLLLFSGLRKHIVGNVDLTIFSPRIEISWVYGTSYITTFFPEPVIGAGNSILKVMSLTNDKLWPVVNSDTYQRFKNFRTTILESNQVNMFEMAHLYLQKGKVESEPEFWLENYYDPDSLYLAIYNRSNSIRVEPPAVYWDHCALRDKLRMNLEFEAYMFYGRVLTCPIPTEPIEHTDEVKHSGFCNDGLMDANSPSISVNLEYQRTLKTLVNCVKRKCPEGTIPHYIKSIDHGRTIDEDIHPNPDPPLPRTVGIHCYPRFELDDKMKGFANDNGCHPRFNKNPFGICQICPEPYPSDCNLFSEEFGSTDHSVLDIFSYNYSTIDEPVYYKDYRVRSFQELRTMREYWDSQKSKLINIYNTIFIWKYQQKSISKECFILQPDRSNTEDYMVDGRAEYTVANASDYPTLDISQQVSEISNGSLTQVVCVKGCEIGFFYEYESISCRKCNIGCGTCTSLENCTHCTPGFNKVQETKHHDDIQEGYPLGFCRPGCQPGFYLQRYTARCRECPQYCLICRDKQKDELEASQKSGEALNDMYCIRCNDTNSEGSALCSDLLTGECVDKCEGEGIFIKVITSSRTGEKYRACERCHDPNCDKCNEDSSKLACVVCKAGFIKNAEGVCVDGWENQYRGMLILGIIVAVVLCCVCCVCFVACLALETSRKPEEEREAILRSKSSKLRMNKKKIQMALAGKARLSMALSRKRRKNLQNSFEENEGLTPGLRRDNRLGSDEEEKGSPGRVGGPVKFDFSEIDIPEEESKNLTDSDNNLKSFQKNASRYSAFASKRFGRVDNNKAEFVHGAGEGSGEVDNGQAGGIKK